MNGTSPHGLEWASAACQIGSSVRTRTVRPATRSTQAHTRPWKPSSAHSKSFRRCTAATNAARSRSCGWCFAPRRASSLVMPLRIAHASMPVRHGLPTRSRSSHIAGSKPRPAIPSRPTFLKRCLVAGKRSSAWRYAGPPPFHAAQERNTRSRSHWKRWATNPRSTRWTSLVDSRRIRRSSGASQRTRFFCSRNSDSPRIPCYSPVRRR